jgi:hypothetical protein
VRRHITPVPRIDSGGAGGLKFLSAFDLLAR